MLTTLFPLFASAFVTLFVVLDPPGVIPIFSSLTSGASGAHRQAMAIRSTAIASGVLLLFAVFGQGFLGALGISLAAFRIAGGIMVFLIAIDMVFEKRTERRESRAEEVTKGREVVEDDISVFPMAIPMLAGPGSIAAVMLLTARARGIERMTALALSLTRDVMGAVLPREVEGWLSGQPQALRLASRLKSVLLDDTARFPKDSEDNSWNEDQHPPLLGTNALLAQTIDSPWKRAGFFWHLATTPSAIERSQVSLPGGFESLWWVLGPIHGVRNHWRRFERGR